MRPDDSCRSVYEAACERVGCRKNRDLLRSLPDAKGSLDGLSELDLSLNLVGRRGIVPVLEVVSRSPRVERLCFADNFLDNTSVQQICEVLQHHPAVSCLDLSRNPISHSAGKQLSELAKARPNLVQILLQETLINPALVRVIHGRTRDNARSRAPGSAPHRRGEAQSTAQGTLQAASGPGERRSSAPGGSPNTADFPPLPLPAERPPCPVPHPAPRPAETPPRPPTPASAAAAPARPPPRQRGELLGWLLLAAARCVPPLFSPAWWGLRALRSIATGSRPPTRPGELPSGQGLSLLAGLMAEQAAPDTGLPPWWGISVARAVASGEPSSPPRAPPRLYVPDGAGLYTIRDAGDFGLGSMLNLVLRLFDAPSGPPSMVAEPATGQYTCYSKGSASQSRATTATCQGAEEEALWGVPPQLLPEGGALNRIYMLAEEDGAAEGEFLGLETLAMLSHEVYPAAITVALGSPQKAVAQAAAVDDLHTRARTDPVATAPAACAASTAAGEPPAEHSLPILFVAAKEEGGEPGEDGVTSLGCLRLAYMNSHGARLH
eukprot:TRINITY_DN1334_c0_g1_i1.p1 TRINITY_DN1334_c0_g1~~TRINITY_DN1334_c0_g1_i1.p1  ORF type:complete len:550 (+),score=91.95 TRINITY_DN1334_c0_g1_i1:126-1775(+)